MESNINNKHNSLLSGIVSLMMSLIFLASPPFERNPQQCEMVKVIGRKKKPDDLTDD